MAFSSGLALSQESGTQHLGGLVWNLALALRFSWDAAGVPVMGGSGFFAGRLRTASVRVVLQSSSGRDCSSCNFLGVLRI